MTTFTVTTKADVVNANDNEVSLREAIALANASAGADTIAFDAAVFNGNPSDIIRLTQGEIAITDTLIIQGGSGVTISGDASANDVTDANGIPDVDASGDFLLDDNNRMFSSTSADLTLDSLALTGGRTTADNAKGGALQSTGSVTLINSTVSGNSTTGQAAFGGGIYAASATLVNSTLSDNSTAGASADRGGLSTPSEATLVGSRLSGATTGQRGTSRVVAVSIPLRRR